MIRPLRLLRLFSPTNCTFLVAVAATVVGWHVGGVLAAEIHAVIQKNRAFNYKQITVQAGDVVQFLNDDEFIHQVYVQSPDFNFDTAESSPGDAINIKFSVKGTFEVHCHIHPKMLLVVKVL